MEIGAGLRPIVVAPAQASYLARVANVGQIVVAHPCVERVVQERRETIGVDPSAVLVKTFTVPPLERPLLLAAFLLRLVGLLVDAAVLANAPAADGRRHLIASGHGDVVVPAMVMDRRLAPHPFPQL